MMKKNIIIIGGAGLLGREIVKTLMQKNNVVVFDVIENKDWLSINQNIKNYFQVDISRDSELTVAIEAIAEDFGEIDCVINTSYPRNKSYGKNAHEVNLKDFNENINLHLGSYFNVMQQFSKLFISQGYGNIINISSIQGVSAPKFEHYTGTSMTSPVEYTAAKSTIIAISKYMAKYLKGKNIRVNCISPGGILNGQPAEFISRYKDSCLNKGMLDPEDLIGAVKFLVSDDSKYINGQNIIVDDGWSL